MKKWKLHCGLIFLFAVTISCQNKEEQSENDIGHIGSWGDQGNGTYKNPILNADYPDVDIQQFGDIYYMISSKQHMAPGMAILESKDLVNWELIGHVWDSLSWAPEYNWDKMNAKRSG